MGNKQSIQKNLNISHNFFSTNITLYIHRDNNKNYSLSRNEYNNIDQSLNINKVDKSAFILQKDSTIKLANFKIIDNQLQLLARVYTSLTNSILSDYDMWSEEYENELVDVSSLFLVTHNDYYLTPR